MPQDTSQAWRSNHTGLRHMTTAATQTRNDWLTCKQKRGWGKHWTFPASQGDDSPAKPKQSTMARLIHDGADDTTGASFHGAATTQQPLPVTVRREAQRERERKKKGSLVFKTTPPLGIFCHFHWATWRSGARLTPCPPPVFRSWTILTAVFSFPRGEPRRAAMTCRLAEVSGKRGSVGPLHPGPKPFVGHAGNTTDIMTSFIMRDIGRNWERGSRLLSRIFFFLFGSFYFCIFPYYH